MLGMHRSGTSTTSGVLHLMGLDLGRSVIGANESNQKGFFENYRIMTFNEYVLGKLKVNWHNTPGLRPDWQESVPLGEELALLKQIIREEFDPESTLLFKDPRMCVLLPLYLKVFKELGIDPSFILTFREPEAVAASLKRRDHFPGIKSERLWLDHMFRAEKDSRRYPRVFISYLDLIRDPVTALEKIGSVVDFPAGLLQSMKPEIRRFIEPEEPSLENLTAVADIFRSSVAAGLTDGQLEKLDGYHKEFQDKFGPGAFPKVSVIATISDSATSTEQSLISIISQDYPNLESIIIDRTRDDRSRRIIGKYQYLMSQRIPAKEMDPSESMRAALSAASGELAVCLNAGETIRDESTITEMVQKFLKPDTGGTAPDAGSPFFPEIALRKVLLDQAI